MSNKNLKNLSVAISQKLSELSSSQQEIFEDEFEKRHHDSTNMLLLAIFFPIHYFFLNKIPLGIGMWLCFLFGWILIGIPSLIAWIIGLVLVKKQTIEFNDDLSKDILKSLSRINS